jgi:L-lactate dehydrogenase (cytochrome)
MDGGIRSGLDVLKALSLGARACLVGRPWAWALGAGGEAMVSRMLGVMRSELTTAMILTGCKTAALANADMLDVAAPQNLSP